MVIITIHQDHSLYTINQLHIVLGQLHIVLGQLHNVLQYVVVQIVVVQYAVVQIQTHAILLTIVNTNVLKQAVHCKTAGLLYTMRTLWVFYQITL
jgi:hypothetical protein